MLAPYDCPPGYHWASTTEGVELLGYEGEEDVPWARKRDEVAALDSPEPGEFDAVFGDLWEEGTQKHRHKRRLALHEGGRARNLTYADECGWASLKWEGSSRRFFRFSDSGPRYEQYLRTTSSFWPDEAHFHGQQPGSTMPQPPAEGQGAAYTDLSLIHI